MVNSQHEIKAGAPGRGSSGGGGEPTKTHPDAEGTAVPVLQGPPRVSVVPRHVALVLATKQALPPRASPDGTSLL